MGELEYFIGCMIKRDITNTTLNIFQPDLIKNMTQGFNKDVKSLTAFNNPATLHKIIVRNQETYTKLPCNLQKRYRSNVGFLLYLVKHERPELYNTVHELYKFMYYPNMINYKARLSEIKYAIGTQYY